MGTDTLVAPIVAALIGLSPAAPSGAAAVPSPSPVVSKQMPSGAIQQQRVLRYWTLGRMVNAISPQKQKPRSSLFGRALPDRRAEAEYAPSATSPGALWPVAGAVAKTVGKVFFTMNGRDFLCSAATIRSANRDLVVTAGHCAKSGKGGWAENWIFVPGYRDGSGPGGGYTARRMFVPDRWSSTGDDDFDVAMVALSSDDGRHVMDAVGANPIAFEQPRGKQTYGFGYPASGRYNGERLAYCSGKPHGDPHGVTQAQGLHCDMTQGSSGGPWLSNFDPATGTGVVTSVSSFKYADDDTTMYGPHFGATVRRLYEQAEQG